MQVVSELVALCVLGVGKRRKNLWKLIHLEFQDTVRALTERVTEMIQASQSVIAENPMAYLEEVSRYF